MPLNVQVVTPDREVTVADDVTLLIAKGIEGDIGLMAGHAPVLIALAAGPLTIVRGETRETMVVDGGFLQMNGEQAIVLAEYVILPHEIDIESTRAEITELERKTDVAAEVDPEDKRRLARAKAIEQVHLIERM